MERKQSARSRRFSLRIKGLVLSAALACLHILWLLAVPPCSAGQESEKNQPTLRQEVIVTLKLLQVYVTDKKGLPVRDLAVGDFELFDNGKRQTITEFERHDLIMAGAAEAGQEAARPSLLTLNRKLFFFFDLVFNNPQGLTQAKKAALHFLDTQAQPTDEIGVISYSIYNGLTIHEYLTTDHQKVREVIEEFGLKSLLGRVQNLEVEYWNAIKDVTGATHTTSPRTIAEGWHNPAKHKLQELSIDRMNYQLHARNFTQRMSDLAEALRLIPGHKHIILFSSGIAGTAFQGPPEAMDRGALNAARQRGDATLYNADSLDADIWEEQKYTNMIREFAQANCPVYVLNTEQLDQNPSFQKAVSGESQLRKISKISGGRYFPHVEDYATDLVEIQNMTGSYYVLGYYIGEKWDGKFHETKVRTRRKDCRVQAQGGYFNPKPFREYSELEKALHLIDLALSDKPQFLMPASLPLVVLACPLPEGNLVVALSEFSRSILPDAAKNRNEIVTIISDQDKNIASFRRVEVAFGDINLSRICVSTFSVLPAGDYQCRMILRNLNTGQSAVASEAVHISKASGSPLVLYPPLLLRSGTGTRYLGIQKTSPTAASGSDNLLASLYPFDSVKYSPLVGEISLSSGELYAEIVCAMTGFAQPTPALAFSVQDAEPGREISIPCEIISTRRYAREEDARGWVAFFCKLDSSGFKPGDYILRVAAKEPELNLAAESSLKIKFR
jgi:VWFA-related protein